jgi:hypothetical protein
MVGAWVLTSEKGDESEYGASTERCGQSSAT